MLHLSTEFVDPEVGRLVTPAIGPRLRLAKDGSLSKLPLVDAPTPYGSGTSALTSFRFGLGNSTNYASTANRDDPSLPASLDAIRGEVRLSLFLRPDRDSTGGDLVLIAGIPGRVGLYQLDSTLVLRLFSGGAWIESTADYLLETSAWHLLEVQWSATRNAGVPMWYVNGQRVDSVGPGLTSPLDSTGDRFDLAHDSSDSASPFWKGAIRELELANGQGEEGRPMGSVPSGSVAPRKMSGLTPGRPRPLMSSAPVAAGLPTMGR